MATISDILLKGGVPATSTTIVFETRDAIPGSSGISSACRMVITTNSSTGAFSIVLPEGAWSMRWRIGRSWNELSLQIPSGTSEYEVSEVDGTAADTSRVEYPYFATVALAQAAVILGSRVDVLADGNTVPAPATFYRGESATYANDGVNGFADSAGTKFSRMQRE